MQLQQAAACARSVMPRTVTLGCTLPGVACPAVGPSLADVKQGPGALPMGRCEVESA